MIQYIVEAIGFQLVFLIIYDVFLKRETFFQWNRAYLIGTYILSMVLPWIKIEALKTTVPEKYYVYPEFLWEGSDALVIGAASENSGMALSWESGIFYGGMILATLYFGYKLYQLRQLRRSGQVKYFPSFTRIIVSNSQMAFSFFRSIFLGDKVLEREHEGIIQHELVHIEQNHTWDLLFFEFMRIIGWFNPLVYVYQNRVSELHEFIADAQVAKTHKKEQYELLLSQVFQTENISFINQFFKSSLIKKRIVMLQKTKSRRILQLKYLMMIPLVFGMLIYTSTEAQMNDRLNSEQNPEDNQLIDKIKLKIHKDIEAQGSLIKVHYNFRDFYNVKGARTILSKEAYFENEILTKMYFEKIGRAIESKGEKFDNTINEMPLPTTTRYKNYVSRKKAFQILDVNLQFSVKAYNQQIGLIDKQDTYPSNYYVYEVESCEDLTGIELRGFNQMLEEIFEKETSDFNKLILTDEDNTFEIYKTNSVRDWSRIKNSKSKGYVEHNNNKITHIVGEYKHRTEGEKSKRNQLMNEILKSREIDTLIVTDGNFSTVMISDSENGEVTLMFQQPQSADVPFPEVDEVPIFQGCENDDDKRGCFFENMREHIRKNFNYPKEAQEIGVQGRVAILFTIGSDGIIKNIKRRGPHALLEDEAERIIKKLPKMIPGKEDGKEVNVIFSIPITFKLNGNPKKNQDILQNYDDAKDVPFAIIDEVPVFPGCENAMDKRVCFNEKVQQHIAQNFKYPKAAQEKGIQGRVSTMFVVDPEGNITNIRQRGPDKLLEDEAQRIMALLPKMIPGKQKGKTVNVPFSIPITFKLSSDSHNDIIKLRLDHGSNRAYVIDGVEATKSDYEALGENNVESLFILNKEASIKKYGKAGKNGVIEVKTKKGN